MNLPKQTNYDTAFALALGALADSDISRRCESSGALYDHEAKVISVHYLNRRCLIQMPEGAFRWEGCPEPVPLRDRILILHYLNQASGKPLSGRLISFGDVPGGQQYLPAFRKRSAQIVLSAFADRPQALLDVAPRLGGTKADLGDVSITIHALPRVPVTFVLWCGDDEVQTSGNILFDSTVSEYLPTEDIAVLGGIVAAKLCKALADPANTL